MRLLRLFVCLTLTLAAGLAAAQKLDGTLKIVVGYSPGGGIDRAARLVGDALRDRLGVNVVVENKPGAGGRVAAMSLKGAPTSENVLMIGNPTVNVLSALAFKDLGYDPEKDFAAVSHVASYGYGVAVGPLVPVKDIAALVAWLKANPKQASFGVPATGGLPHLIALKLADGAKVEAQVIGYRGSAPLALDVVGGQLPVGVDTLESLTAQHEGGKLRILATGGARRSPELKDVPTLREQGFDIVAEGWYAFFASAAMPPEKVALLGRVIAQIMTTPEMQAKFHATAMEPVVATPEQTARMVAAFRAKWEPVFRAAKLEQ
ncbi:MAG: tripartite tricarboxylate transporter substrate-binding protein [Betaproteobacteria bacterium]